MVWFRKCRAPTNMIDSDILDKSLTLQHNAHQNDTNQNAALPSSSGAPGTAQIACHARVSTTGSARTAHAMRIDFGNVAHIIGVHSPRKVRNNIGYNKSNRQQSWGSASSVTFIVHRIALLQTIRTARRANRSSSRRITHYHLLKLQNIATLAPEREQELITNSKITKSCQRNHFHRLLLYLTFGKGNFHRGCCSALHCLRVADSYHCSDCGCNYCGCRCGCWRSTGHALP